ncbi:MULTISPECIES: DUF4153 domain-containing protein [unclassified Herbaspirillum]|uniref:DUF4153 domain-containing protein n=1 Tax=unclassified Herbaspirillum TaxID=2624150 RepID=UPI000E2F5D49|nr:MULTISPECIES: DUF4153 domain-containing protein [unclassified Herbaspirillum]RFB69474.1 DUF4153 domain-containing protein [Herbaspirillum sp. 3R-3a1]TFI07470.1 DUF4153 domain-containing protein [Herbaspirillum sp. 3R11]TFI12244.1 DUF4153 domain-containing protein [Herbaspirillum sp. 3R-11]TFI19411.1 DUF4153 domain-containing protein [Herbaspirillum sp. 3C11]
MSTALPNNAPPDDNDALHSPVSILSGRLRIALGVLQGVLLYALYSSWNAKSGLAMQPLLFVPALMLAAFLPIVAVSGIGHLSRRNLLIWLAALAVILSGLGVYDAWRADLSSLLTSAGKACCDADMNGHPEILPSATLFLLAVAGLFIAQAMMLAGDADGRRIASYRSYFEMAWKLLVQLLFATLFTGLFWLVLETGNALFSLIKLDFLDKLLEKSWFHIPVTTLAFSSALHLSDVRPQIVAGIRKLLLTLLSWLLPMATVVIGAFLLSILATGLEPLWQTRRATHVLLGAAALLVVLINTVYQDGNHLTEHTHRFFTACLRVACLLPAPLVLLAVYSLGLRIAEYGWTVSRVAAATCALVAAMYAAGYALAALSRRDKLQRIASTNVLASFAILIVFLALLSPLADPARIAVADQLHRLAAGKTVPERFDFLRFDGARFGVQELKRLSEQKNGAYPAAVEQKARQALASNNRWNREELDEIAPDAAKNIRVHPVGGKLPKEFVAQDWRNDKQRWSLPSCMTRGDRQCDAYLVKPDPAGAEQVLVFDGNSMPALFASSGAGADPWRLAGKLMATPSCIEELKKTAERGALNWQPPLQRDIDINGVHLRMQVEQTVTKCAPDELKK